MEQIYTTQDRPHAGHTPTIQPTRTGGPAEWDVI